MLDKELSAEEVYYLEKTESRHHIMAKLLAEEVDNLYEQINKELEKIRCEASSTHIDKINHLIQAHDAMIPAIVYLNKYYLDDESPEDRNDPRSHWMGRVYPSHQGEWTEYQNIG